MENVISILIVEDEEIWIEQLKHILIEFGYNIVQAVRTVEDALATLSSTDYDLVLLDIRLNGKDSGIELGKIISDLYKKPFIFITASPNNLIKGSADIKPSAYLPKPINPSSLYFAIQTAINNFNSNQPALEVNDAADFTSFFIKQGSRYKKIDWKDVVYLCAGKNYTSVFNSPDETEYFVRSSLLKVLQFQIPRHLQKLFIQVNRSEVVQFQFIREVTNDELITPFKVFSISDTFSKELKRKLNIIS